MSASIGFGIASGCALAGKLSQSRIRFELVTAGAWGLVFGLCCLAGIGLVDYETLPVEWIAWLLLVELGVSAGLFVVPLQVFMQTRPPVEHKGRMIGAMNLINWIAILAASGFYYLCAVLLSPVSWTFGVLAAAVLPVAMFSRPAHQARCS